MLVQYRHGDTVTALQATGFRCLSECEIKQDTGGKPDRTHKICEIFLWATQQSAQKSKLRFDSLIKQALLNFQGFHYS